MKTLDTNCRICCIAPRSQWLLPDKLRMLAQDIVVIILTLLLLLGTSQLRIGLWIMNDAKDQLIWLLTGSLTVVMGSWFEWNLQCTAHTIYIWHQHVRLCWYSSVYMHQISSFLALKMGVYTTTTHLSHTLHHSLRTEAWHPTNLQLLHKVHWKSQFLPTTFKSRKVICAHLLLWYPHKQIYSRSSKFQSLSSCQM